MDQLGWTRSRPAIEPALSRRRLLQSAGLGVGATLLLQPHDVAARWLDIEIRFTNHGGVKRPLTIELWSRDDSWKEHWTLEGKHTFPANGEQHDFFIARKDVSVWIEGKYLTAASNPLFGFPSAGWGFGGNFDGNGWGGPNRKFVSTGPMPDEGRGRLQMKVDGLGFQIFRGTDTADAKVFYVDVFDEDHLPIPPRRRKRRRRRGRRRR